MCTRAPSIFEFQNLNQNVSEANCVSLKFSHMRHLLESAYCTGQWEYETSNWLQKTYTGQCFIALNSGFSHNISIANTTLALMYFHLSTFICCIFYRLFFATTIFRFLIAKNCHTFLLPNLTKDMESFSKFYGIAFSQEEREVPWIIIKGLLARSLDTSWCDHRFLYDPIPSVRGGLTKTDYHLIASTKTDFQFFLQHNYFSCLWSTI